MASFLVVRPLLGGRPAAPACPAPASPHEEITPRRWRTALLLLAVIALALEASAGAGGRHGTPIAALLQIARPVSSLGGVEAQVARPAVESSTVRTATAAVDPPSPRRESRGTGRRAGAVLIAEHVADGTGNSAHDALLATSGGSTGTRAKRSEEMNTAAAVPTSPLGSRALSTRAPPSSLL